MEILSDNDSNEETSSSEEEEKTKKKQKSPKIEVIKPVKMPKSAKNPKITDFKIKESASDKQLMLMSQFNNPFNSHLPPHLQAQLQAQLNPGMSQYQPIIFITKPGEGGGPGSNGQQFIYIPNGGQFPALKK